MRLPEVPRDWARKPFGFFIDPHFRHQSRWIMLAVLIGCVAGVGAIGFDLLFQFCQRWLLEGIAGFSPPGAGIEGGTPFGPLRPWLLPVSLGVGGLIAGAIVFGFAPETEGHGTDAVIQAFHHLRGKIRRRVPFVKIFASAVTIGSGGAAGREGPIAQIGAGFGSFLADLGKMRNRDRRVLMMAGVAGGIGAIFRAPLGAALFAAECLYMEPEFEYEVLLPGLISAITGYSIFSSFAGWGVLFDVPPIAFHEPSHLIVYALLGIACAFAGRIYPPFFYGMRDRFFRPLRIPRWTKPALGGVLLGGVAIAYPQSLGMGYGYIQEALHGEHTAGFLIGLAGLRILAVSLTLSSGGSGGVFGPSLVIGGALGGALGTLVAATFPEIAPTREAAIMVGMCGFFAGVAKTPLAAVIMVMEMTGSYGLLVPCLLVAAISYLFIPPAVKLYEQQVASRRDSPAHTGSFALEVLAKVRVADSFQPLSDRIITIRESDTLDALIRRAAESPQAAFPVVDAEGRLRGEVSIEDIRIALLEDVPREVFVALDLMRPVPRPLTPDDTLATAAQLVSDKEEQAVPVVQSRDDPLVLGLLDRRDLILAYGRIGEDEE